MAAFRQAFLFPISQSVPFRDPCHDMAVIIWRLFTITQTTNSIDSSERLETLYFAAKFIILLVSMSESSASRCSLEMKMSSSE